MVIDITPVIRSESPGKIVFWGLVGKAAIVLYWLLCWMQPMLSTLQLSDADRTTKGFVSKRSVHTCTEHGSRIWQGVLPVHSNWDCSGQPAVNHENSSFSTFMRIKCTGTSKGRGRYHDDS